MTTPKTPLDLDSIRTSLERLVAHLDRWDGNDYTLEPSDVDGAVMDIETLIAEVERLRAEDLSDLRTKVARVEALLCDPYREPPANGTLLVRGSEGGHQDLPYLERAFVRDDREEGAYPDGDWRPVKGGGELPWSFGEIHALDDPACDRVSVSLEPYVHVDAIARALGGGAE